MSGRITADSVEQAAHNAAHPDLPVSVAIAVLRHLSTQDVTPALLDEIANDLDGDN